MLFRKIKSFIGSDQSLFLKKALAWGESFEYCAYLTPNNLSYLHEPFIHVLAIGAKSVIQHQTKGAFAALQNHHAHVQDWLFGYFTYDLKNDIESLHSVHEDSIGFEPLCFFQPEHLIFFEKDKIDVHSFSDPAEVFNTISNFDVSDSHFSNKAQVEARLSKDKYIATVNSIKEDIVNGEIYELNFCFEFLGNATAFHPLSAFEKLNQLSPMPFAAFQRINDKYLLCASPERFLKKTGHKLISQPIKGTISRGISPSEDEQLKAQLFHSEKERAENMMIVDLVRNDLAKSAVPGTVNVEELFGIYSYEKVHQMVSTITATLRPEVTFVDAIRNAFPMGSMTGAPKIRTMELIEKYELSQRGLYSGATGYITPSGDFDLNVVIRSLLYNATTKNLSFQVGSAITYDAVAALEYEECLLKANAILEVLST